MWLRRVSEALVLVVAVVLGWFYFDTVGKVRYDLVSADFAARRHDTNYFAGFSEKLNQPITGRRRGDYSFALHLAIAHEAFDLVDYLLAHGADPKLKDSPYGRDLLMSLVDIGNPPERLLVYCLEAGLSVNSVDAEGTPLIHHAAINASTNVLQFLLRNGADSKAEDRKGNTALHVVRNVPNARVLLLAGTPIHSTNVAGLTPTEIARRLEENELLAFLSGETTKR
jgi:ankyrin repeat protein